jgi:hypothetical protein
MLLPVFPLPRNTPPDPAESLCRLQYTGVAEWRLVKMPMAVRPVEISLWAPKSPKNSPETGRLYPQINNLNVDIEIINSELTNLNVRLNLTSMVLAGAAWLPISHNGVCRHRQMQRSFLQ